MDGVDEIYKDFSNKHILVQSLIPLVCKKVRGEISKEDMEKELQQLRAEALKK